MKETNTLQGVGLFLIVGEKSPFFRRLEKIATGYAYTSFTGLCHLKIPDEKIP